MKSLLMWAYEVRLLSFDSVEWISKRLRRYRWFREG